MVNPKDRTTPRPMAVGKWIYRRGGMLCRLPLKQLRVSAPLDFLRAVESSCDGKATWEDVRNGLISRWTADDVDSCLSTLLEQGALVDAGHFLAEQAQVGWTPQPFAAPFKDAESLYALRRSVDLRLAEPCPEANKLRPQDTPLTDLLRNRGSARTFDDKSIPLQSVVNILWSIYGVLREGEAHVRRTVPSGGALYGLRWFMALLRPMEGYPSGLYEIRYHATGVEGGALSLERRAGDANGAWSTLLTPSVLSFAHAVIYPVADIRFIGKKYGNRSLTLALLEAGHALQNGSLAAQCEDATTIVRGDTVEMEVLSLLGLEESLYPLPAMVLGAKSLPGQEELAHAAASAVPVKSVPLHSQRLALSTRVAVAGPIRIGRQTPVSSIWTAGRSECARTAAIKAEAEAWERIGWSTPAAELKRAPMSDIPNPLDPRLLVRYDQSQYQDSGFPFASFSIRRRYPWLAAVRANDGAETHVMAQCVYALSSLTAADQSRPFTNASTSGVAAYTDMDTARSHALIELVERDAFARAWLGRVAPPVLVEAGLPRKTQLALARLRNAGYTVSVHVLHSAHLPVIAVFAQHVSSAFTSVTTAAGFHWEDAAASALSETESRVQQRHGKQAHVAIRMEDVTLASHHGDFFCSRASFRSADWFASSKAQISVRDRVFLPSNASQLLNHFFDLKLEVHFCDLTPPNAAVDQGRTPLYVARAFVPSLVPIWFGYKLAPLGIWDRYRSTRKELHKALCPLSIHPCT